LCLEQEEALFLKQEVELCLEEEDLAPKTNTCLEVRNNHNILHLQKDVKGMELDQVMEDL
jgi:hypothetical protein